LKKTFGFKSQTKCEIIRLKSAKAPPCASASAKQLAHEEALMDWDQYIFTFCVWLMSAVFVGIAFTFGQHMVDFTFGRYMGDGPPITSSTDVKVQLGPFAMGAGFVVISCLVLMSRTEDWAWAWGIVTSMVIVYAFGFLSGYSKICDEVQQKKRLQKFADNDAQKLISHIEMLFKGKK